MYLRMLSQIRPNITQDSAATLVHAFITSKLDCMNGLLAGLPGSTIRKLQLIQNNAARIVLQKKKRDHVTPLLRQLHWLPVQARIKYKVCLLTHKALHGKAPPYISSLLHQYVPPRPLRSAGRGLLRRKMPNLNTVGARAFEVYAPSVWNLLPEGLRCCEGLNAFKTNLKTHLFRESFNG